ncbi:hypothetical protein G1H11_09510 [Phytoactinopolyspora alkaliphila]|uniref:Lipoprotein n=1 Tax=Phytoactinopolyspora alkaliphila TaxID=1783498 RepID=A0A6N9YKV2_9ACTN|nr:hypothetical protein [Phytoactinopolyspora alkaliphila]NED95550.1 hypothetical protein [Phytoactinopolyspora alkaliphila]
MNRRNRVLAALAGTLAVGVFTACGSDDDAATTGGDTDTTINGETEDTDAGTDDTETDEDNDAGTDDTETDEDNDAGTDDTETDEDNDEDEDDDAGGDGNRVELADTDLGEILVDGEGRTLYLFTVDEPGQSNCEDDCLDAWPPLEGEATAGEGVNADLLGTVERSDGSTQASYADWPLYYFAADETPGDLNGQGVNDVWYVIDAEGNAIEDLPEEDSGY